MCDPVAFATNLVSCCYLNSTRGSEGQVLNWKRSREGESSNWISAAVADIKPGSGRNGEQSTKMHGVGFIICWQASSIIQIILFFLPL